MNSSEFKYLVLLACKKLDWSGSVGCIDWTLIKSYKIDRPDLLEYMDFH